MSATPSPAPDVPPSPLHQDVAPPSQSPLPGVTDRVRFRRFQQHGFSPQCILDVGASTGVWSDYVAEVFPSAEFHLFEPAAEIEEIYRERIPLCLAEHENFTLHKLALGARPGTVRLYKGGGKLNPWGSTTLDMADASYFEAVAEVPLVRLEDLIDDGAVPQPQLIKMDIQGGELEVLEGLGPRLAEVEFLVLEVWLSREYGAATPLFHEITAWLAQRRFFLVDLSDSWRDAEGFLIHQDLVFANANSPSVARYRFEQPD